MKLTTQRTVEVEVDTLIVSVPVSYGEEDIPNDFPGRTGDTWTATIDLETGMIRNWTGGRPRILHMKVVDGGTYYLQRGDTRVAAIECDYVPSFFPGAHYGDYIIFNIDANGQIEGWRARPRDVEKAFMKGRTS